MTETMTETERLTAELAKTAIPEYMRPSVVSYLTGTVPYHGGFLTALLKNDLRGAVLRADARNAACLGDWIRFLIDHAPSASWGSPEKVRDWQRVCLDDTHPYHSLVTGRKPSAP